MQQGVWLLIMNDNITKSFLKKLSKNAKEIVKSSGHTHMQALDITAKSSGFSSYHEVQTIYKRHQSLATQDDFDKIYLPFFINNVFSHPKIKTDIERVIASQKRLYSQPTNDFDRRLIDEVNKGIIDKSHSSVKNVLDEEIIRIQKFNNLMTSEQLDQQINTLLITGILPGDKLTESGSHLIYTCIDKEWFKENGYRLINSSDSLFGHHLVALGHFWRSVINRRNIEYHPNFKVYMADWIYAFCTADKIDIQKLKSIYPKNKTSGLLPGDTYWK